jgi:streptogramin lyase
MAIAVAMAMALTAFVGASSALAAAPVITSAPVISPETAPVEGSQISTSNGKWKNEPTSFSYQWRLCNSSGTGCADVTGATKSTYTVGTGDVGHTFVCVVTAYNADGSASFPSLVSKVAVAKYAITEYKLSESTGTEPSAIAQKSNGTLWYTAHNTIGHTNGLGTPLSGFSLPPGYMPIDIAYGSDNNMWFTQTGGTAISKINSIGAITEYPVVPFSSPRAIAAGASGDLWFTYWNRNYIGKITTAGVVTEYAIPSIGNDIVMGKEGNMWFTLRNQKIAKITPEGAITEYSTSGVRPSHIAVDGATGDLWFTADNEGEAGLKDAVGKITTSGVVTTYPFESNSINPWGIVIAKDGKPWITETGPSKLGRVEASGAVTTFALPAGSDPHGITNGPEGFLWFANTTSSKIGSIVP